VTRDLSIPSVVALGSRGWAVWEEARGGGDRRREDGAGVCSEP
jgi:hypothetical protein